MTPAMRAPKQPEAQTRQFSEWEGLNRVDSRTRIKDGELFWNENAMTIGKGSIQILNGPGTAIATVTGGVTAWGMTLNGNAVALVVASDGSITQVTIPGGVKTVVAPAGAVTTNAFIFGPWQGTTALIIDPTTGYHSWNGAAFTTISALQVGDSGAVFEGRAFLASQRTLTYTAPTTFSDFTVGAGAGTTTLTDQAFPGNIVVLASALEQLWIVGEGAIDTLSNVTASGSPPTVTTTFSITNIVADLGTASGNSVRGYLRSLALNTVFGVYALSGVTPQKISDALDGLYPDLTLNDCPAAVGVVQSLLCLMFLVTYNGNEAEAESPGPTQLLLVFSKGRWCLGAQGTTLRWITSVLVAGEAQAWGMNEAGEIYQLFGATNATPVKYKIKSKLYDFGLAVLWKELINIAVEVQSSQAIEPTLTVDSESSSRVVEIEFRNRVQFQNAAGEDIQFQNALAQDVFFFAVGLVSSQRGAVLAGNYLGWSLSGEDPPYRIGMVALQYAPSPPEEWVTRSVGTA